MAVNYKRLRQKIDEAQHFARRAKPFLSLMTALSELGDELAGMGEIEVEAQAAERRKADAEWQIPALEKRIGELQQAKESAGELHQSRMSAMERDLREKAETRRAELEKEHQQRKAETEEELRALASTKAELEKEVKDLERQKKAAEGAIDRINKSLQRAGQSLNVNA